MENLANSMYRLVSQWMPYNPYDPLHHPKKKEDLSRVPNGLASKKILWAAQVFGTMDLEQVRLLLRKMQERVSPDFKKEDNSDSDTLDPSPTHEYMAGEVGLHGETAGRVVMEEAAQGRANKEKEPELTLFEKVMRLMRLRFWMLLIMSLSATRKALGITQEFTLFTLDDHSMQHSDTQEYRAMHTYLLQAFSAHSAVFSLENMLLVNLLLHRLTAMAQLSHKTVHDLRAVNDLGKILGADVDTYLKGMTALGNDFADDVKATMREDGVALHISRATHAPTATDVKCLLQDMGAPSNPAHALTQHRLAMVALFFPNAPKPQHTKKRDLAKKMKQAPTDSDTPEASAQEMMDYANALGVEVYVLEKAADHVLRKTMHIGDEMLGLMSSHSVAPNMGKSVYKTPFDDVKSMKPDSA